MDALSAAPRLFQRNTAHGRFGLFLYIGFAVGVATPPGKGEALLHRLLEFSIIRWLVRIGLAKRQRAIEQRLLNFNQQRAHRSRDPVLVDERLPFFPRTVASRQHHRILRHILRAQFHPQRNAAHFPVVKLESRAGAFALVELHPNVGVHELRAQAPRALHHAGFFFVRFINRHDHNLDGRQPRRKNQTLVVTVHHDDRAHETRRKPPRSGPAEFLHPGLVQIFNFESLGEILPQIMRRPGLQRLAVAHHRFDRVRSVRPGESLGVRFFAGDHRHRRFFHREIGVDVQHLPCFGFRFFLRRVRGVPFLPKKFQGPQKKFGAQLPTHHAVPLVDQHRQVAVRLNPFRIGPADNRFGRRPDHQRLFQLFATPMRHHRQLRRKSGHVRFFLIDKTARNQHRKRRVDVPRSLEPPVQLRRNVLPQRPAVRPHNHAPAHRRIIRQFRPRHQLVVPLREIFRPRR